MKLFLSLLALFLFIGCSNQSKKDVKQNEKVQKKIASKPLQKSTLKKLSYTILKEEKQKKGASFNPPLPAKYTLLVVKAALIGDNKLNKNNVTTALNNILSEVRKNNKNVDAITADLYKSKTHFNDGQPFFSQIEWWPKNHSLSRLNQANIMNKTTYKTDVKIFSLPEEIRDKSILVTKYSLNERKEIFRAKGNSERRAEYEADKKYDPSIQWKQHLKEVDILAKKYSEQLCKKYKISEKELGNIIDEGFIRDW